MKVMVTGGAGYIGSHAVRQLLAGGHEVVVLDTLDRGHREAVEAAAGGASVPLEELDLRQPEAIARAMTHHRVEGVMHFAALAYVGESVRHPLRYYDNNVVGTVRLLQAMREAGVRRLVFSSTCATYGQPGPDSIPITEDVDQRPINPYGRSKWMIEQVLADEAAADDRFTYAALRYFNVAGCASDGTLGEDHEPETHLIPIVLQVALGQREHVTIFGEDYDTPDGTCIRDYIHVEDLVRAHITVMEALGEGDRRLYNLGIGRGRSVREVIESARRVTGCEIPARIGPRRPGDPPLLYADSSRIARELRWQARITDIDPIIESAWRWFRNHPQGYERP